MNGIYKKLTVPLPPEAIKPHPTKSYLSTIKAIYVTERFNEVFGIEGWSIRTDVIHWFEKTSAKGRIEYTVMAKTSFTAGSIYHECIAGSTNEDLGDAAKGATTDAITKIGSYIGVGIDVFKGGTNVAANKAAPKAPAPAKPKAPKKLEELTPAHKSWEYVKDRVKGGVPIETIKQSFRLTEETIKLLNESK